MAGFPELLWPISWKHDGQGRGLSYSCPVSPHTTATAQAGRTPISQMGLQRPAFCLALVGSPPRDMPIPLLLPPAGLNWKLEITQTEFCSWAPTGHMCRHLLASPASLASRTNVTSHLHTIWVAPHVGGSDLTLSREALCTCPGCLSSHCPAHCEKLFKARVCRDTSSSEVRNPSWVLKRRQPSWEERGPLNGFSRCADQGAPCPPADNP